MAYQVNLSDIISLIEPTEVVGPTNITITKIIPLGEQTNPSTIVWCNEKGIAKLSQDMQGALIAPNVNFDVPPNVTCLKVAKPRYAFKSILEKFFSPSTNYTISPSSKYPIEQLTNKKIHLGEFVVIEQGCVIGDDVVIDHGTVIKANTQIGNHVRIGANCTIGGPGFGFEKNDQGVYEYIPQIGSVIIEDNVHIGDNCCIDRAALGQTIIRSGARFDNMVHVAHGCDIGKNVIIAAQAMIAGSTVIQDNVWVGPSVSVMNKITIGQDSLIGLGAVVIKDVPPGSIMVGNPAKPLSKK